MENEYSTKEIAVFDGVMRLIEQGSDLHAVKVSDIALAAGIGKGTLYNYFQSKEEIITRTILYYLEVQVKSAVERVEAEQSFYCKCRAGLDFLENTARQKNNALQFLLFNFEANEAKNLMDSAGEMLLQRKRQLEDLIMEIATVGSEEGLFPSQQDRSYVFQVFVSALFGFFQLFCSHLHHMDEESIGRARGNAYQMILKSLN